jgi:hypothetical protein
MAVILAGTGGVTGLRAVTAESFISLHVVLWPATSLSFAPCGVVVLIIIIIIHHHHIRLIMSIIIIIIFITSLPLLSPLPCALRILGITASYQRPPLGLMLCG